MAETVTAREAAEILCGWPNYALVQWHARRGRLKQIKVSDRKRRYLRREVETLAKNATTH